MYRYIELLFLLATVMLALALVACTFPLVLEYVGTSRAGAWVSLIYLAFAIIWAVRCNYKIILNFKEG